MNCMFMSFVTPGAMLAAVRFSIVPDMPSGPLDLVVSIAKNISRISSFTHRSSSGQEHWSG